MYFNPQVKEQREDFFNFEFLQEDLKSALKNELIPLIAVHGLRRTGKSSLMRVVLNSLKKKYIWIDGRSITSRREFYNKVASETQKLKRFRIEKVSIKGVELTLDFFNKGLDYLNKHRIFLVVDEVQLLKRFKLDYIIAAIYDDYPHIKTIISGSETGMLMNFLGKKNAKAPLYGRAVYELQTQRLNREGAFRFLKLGAAQTKLSLKDSEAISAIDKLDGIIGWLTKYGWYRLKLSHKNALRKVIEEGKLIAREEFLRFAARTESKYLNIVKSIKDGARWSEIKEKTSIPDKQLYTLLQRLIDYGFIEKRDGVYTIADPLLETAI